MKCYVFDILFLAGRDLRDRSLRARRAVLEGLDEKVFSKRDMGSIRLAERAVTDKQAFYQRVVSAGGEGVMLKNETSRYIGQGRPPYWYKVKKTTTVDAIITGFIPGKNAYEGLVGAFEVSLYNESGELTPVAAVSQMTLADRNDFSVSDGNGLLDIRQDLYGRVVEVVFQELTKTGRGRHAVLLRFRDDKEPKDCTTDQIKDLRGEREMGAS